MSGGVERLLFTQTASSLGVRMGCFLPSPARTSPPLASGGAAALLSAAGEREEERRTRGERREERGANGVRGIRERWRGGTESDDGKRVIAREECVRNRDWGTLAT